MQRFSKFNGSLAYLLAITALVVRVLGRLGDLLGRRKTATGRAWAFCTGIGAVCGAPSLEWLIGARGYKGWAQP